MKTKSNPGVILVLDSKNKKLGNGVAATYVSQESCPKTCPFLEEGCYAELGNTGIHTRRLNKSTATPENFAIAEAMAIRDAVDKIYGDGQARRGKKIHWHWYKPLRGHVVGDTTKVSNVRIVATAYELWQRWFGEVWTYTHAWRRVARKHWRGVSVLASCETFLDVHKAHDRGYAAAIVVDRHAGDKAYRTKTGLRIVPCPNQTRGVTCKQCQLCWKDQWLLKSRTVIAFEAHGSGKERVKEKLIQIGNKI